MCWSEGSQRGQFSFGASFWLRQRRYHLHPPPLRSGLSGQSPPQGCPRLGREGSIVRFLFRGTNSFSLTSEVEGLIWMICLIICLFVVLTFFALLYPWLIPRIARGREAHPQQATLCIQPYIPSAQSATLGFRFLMRLSALSPCH